MNRVSFSWVSGVQLDLLEKSDSSKTLNGEEDDVICGWPLRRDSVMDSKEYESWPFKTKSKAQTLPKQLAKWASLKTELIWAERNSWYYSAITQKTKRKPAFLSVKPSKDTYKLGRASWLECLPSVGLGCRQILQTGLHLPSWPLPLPLGNFVFKVTPTLPPTPGSGRIEGRGANVGEAGG